MPAVSKAQFRTMWKLYNQKKITKKQVDDFTKGVDYKSLPEKAKKTKKKKARK